MNNSQKAPAFDELSTSTEKILETGIKLSTCLLATKVVKVGLFGGTGVGKTVLIQS